MERAASPHFSWRVVHTSRDAEVAFAVLALGAFALLFFPGPPCFEGGRTAGSPFPYYEACNGPVGSPALEHWNASAIVADTLFWGLVAFGLAHLWRRRSALRRAEITPAAPPEPGRPRPPRSP